MVSLNVLSALFLLILGVLILTKLSRKFGFQKLSDVIGLVSVLTCLVFLLFFGAYLMFPLEMMRLVTGNKSIPTSAEYAAEFDRVKKALTHFTNQQYVSKSKSPAQIDRLVGIVIPEQCGYYPEDLAKLNDESAAKEISKIVALLNSTDDELIKSYRNLDLEQQEKVRTGGISRLGSTDEAQLPISIRTCTLKKLSYFGPYASNAKAALFKILGNKKLFYETSSALLRLSTELNADDVDSIVEHIYSSDIELQKFAKQLLHKLSPDSDDKLLSLLGGNNPVILSAIIDSFKVRNSKNPKVIDAMYNVADQSMFESISAEAFSVFLLFTQSLDEERERRVKLALKGLGKEDAKSVSQYLDALTTNPVSDTALLSPLKHLFNSQGNIEIRIKVLQTLGSMGEISSSMLADIAFESFYKASSAMFTNYRAVNKFGADALSSSCNVVTHQSDNNKSGGTALSWELSSRCPVGEIDPAYRIILKACEDPANHSQLSIALRDAIAKVGITAVEPLLKHLDSSNPIFKSIVYSGIIKTADETVYEKIPRSAPENEHLWNQVSFVKIAGLKDTKIAKDLLPNVIKNRMFPECMKIKSFSDHYSSLGREILE